MALRGEVRCSVVIRGGVLRCAVTRDAVMWRGAARGVMSHGADFPWRGEMVMLRVEKVEES